MPKLRLTALLSCLLLAASAQAQFPPGGGGGRGSMDKGGGGERGHGERRQPPAQAGEARMPLVPERLRVWHTGLVQLQPMLALQPAQTEAWDALMRDLRDLAELNERRRDRKPPVSAVVDVDRDLRLEQEALADHAAAYADVRRFHQRLKEVLTAQQYQQVLEAYKASLPPLRP